MLKSLFFIPVLVAAFMCLSASGAYAGGFSICAGCHNGASAPDITGKYRTADELVKAAKMTRDVRMQRYKNDDKALRDAAKDLGLK